MDLDILLWKKEAMEQDMQYMYRKRQVILLEPVSYFKKKVCLSGARLSTWIMKQICF